MVAKTLESPWTARRSNQSMLKEIKPEYIGRTDVEAPKLRPSVVKSRLIGKDSGAGRD